MADTKLVVFNADAGSAYIDMRSEATNGEGRQVVVLGDPSVNANVAAVASQDLGGSDQTTSGIVMRLAGSASVQIVGSLATIGIYVGSTAGTIGVRFGDEPTVIASGKQSTTTRPFIVNTDGAIKVYDLVNGTISTVSTVTALTDITNSIKVHLLSTGGTLIVKLDPAGTAFVNAAHTASIFTVSGSTSGGTTSGVTLVSPSANYNFKVFAYSIQTTGVVSSAIRFTNGAGSETELWRPLITAASSSSSPVGANLAVTPPGYIFATGTNTTLALKNDAGSLVHYSVSYFKESA